LIDGTEIEDDQLVIVTGATPRPDQTVGMDGATIWRIKLEADFVREQIDLDNKVLVSMDERENSQSLASSNPSGSIRPRSLNPL